MEEVYREHLNRFQEELASEKGRNRRIGWLRFWTFSGGFLCYVGWDVWSGPPGTACGWGLVAASALYLLLAVRQRRARGRRNWCEAMVRINRAGLARIRRDWGSLPQSLFPSPDPRHPYAMDLDVCGEASLARLLTTVTLPPGVETLRRWLLNPAPPREIRRRQEAVAELAALVDFRQLVEARGRLTENPPAGAIEGFLQWAEEDGWLTRRSGVLLAARVLPILSGCLFLLFWVGRVDAVWWVACLGGGFVFGTQLRSRVHPLMEAASAGQERFGRYAEVLNLFLGTPVEAPALRDLQASVRGTSLGAGRELRRLGRRVGWADVRYSPMAHAPLQALVVWDVHALRGLERWKARSGRHVRQWLEALGELEALCALAALKADHPDWCLPTVREGPEVPGGEWSPGLTGTALGHPLLAPGVCVRNDVQVGPPGSFVFVTGSNMSGKSTLLRAVGLNAVLAQAGGPVCAEAMTMAPSRIHTSMRTGDSLVEGVSQYMAELNRIREVVEAARREGDTPVLFLLDEPLQGTNEAERRVAVQTILGHLLAAGAVGAVATHDLRLDDTVRLKPAARAVHLEGTVVEGEAGPVLSFDYRLKPGRATATNALALLRAVGLGEGGE